METSIRSFQASLVSFLLDPSGMLSNNRQHLVVGLKVLAQSKKPTNSIKGDVRCNKNIHGFKSGMGIFLKNLEF